MTKWIRLRETLSGGRADGRPWPVAGEVVDVPDWEYDHCIAAGWAEHADPPAPPKAAKAKEPEKAPEPTAHPRPTGWESEQYGQQATQEKKAPVKAPEPEPEPEPAEPPRPSDPKQDWIAYAQSRGMNPVTASSMSKADLMSRFGWRL